MAAMLNPKAMVLCCGSAPASPPVGAGGGGGSTTATLGRLPEGPRARIGAPWRASGFPEGCRARIGGGPLALLGRLEGAPRVLAGPARPSALTLPEGELDGCEPDAEPGSEGLVPSPTLSVASSQEGEPEVAAAAAAEEEDGEGGLPRRHRHDDLRKVTLELVGRYLREAAKEGGGAGKFLQGLVGRFGTTQGGGGGECVARALETLRRVGDGILDKHQLAFQGMLKKMEIKKEDDLKIMSEVASQVFSDGITNWGRIVTLISFGAFVAKYLKSINQESGINTLTEIITDVLVTDKREWLVNHNAWEGFVKFFHVEDIEGSIRNVLMTFAGVAGLGASLAYMIR